MDDADSALLEHAEVLKQNLESDKFYLLAGCSKPQWVPGVSCLVVALSFEYCHCGF